MSLVVVIRNQGFQYIFEGKMTRSKFERIKEACFSTKMRKSIWIEKADKYVLENYKVIPASLIAENLSVLLRKPVSKNMVISRYHKLTKKKELR